MQRCSIEVGQARNPILMRTAYHETTCGADPARRDVRVGLELPLRARRWWLASPAILFGWRVGLMHDDDGKRKLARANFSDQHISSEAAGNRTRSKSPADLRRYRFSLRETTRNNVK
jgi:hypothetical protein